MAMAAKLCPRVGAGAWITSPAATASRFNFGNGQGAVVEFSSKGHSHYQQGWLRRDGLQKASAGSILTGRSKFRAGALYEETGAEVSTLEEPASVKAVQKEEGEEEPPAESQDVVEEEQDASPKASVTFILQKQIHFGQIFNVVGSIPELGEWDVTGGVPLEWSEGHVWTTQVAIPVGQTVEYKFVLTGKRGELEWQPGENRKFETIDASNLVVSELWDPSELPPAEVSSEEAPLSEVPEATSEVSGELDGKETSTIGVAPGRDSVTLPVAEAVSKEEEVSGSVNAKLEAAAEESSSEVPLVGTALVATVTAVTEVSGQVEDPAAGEV